MASGYKNFTAGDILTAAQVNDYLMKQATMRFASATARDAAITSPTEGMVCYLDDVNQIFFYTGSAWMRTAGEIPFFYGYTNTMSVTNNSETTSIVGTVTNRTGFSNSSGVITVPHTGIYSITALSTYPPSATGIRHTSIGANGGIIADVNLSAASASVTQHSVSIIYYLTAGSTVSMRVYQNSGGTQTVTTALSIAQVGA